MLEITNWKFFHHLLVAQQRVYEKYMVSRVFENGIMLEIYGR